ncbi:MAG: RNA polymerase sigma factor [Bacteroidetes bacterium]|nr:RNA polymerase sigma factor [Bacteroidota bacterium]
MANNNLEEIIKGCVFQKRESQAELYKLFSRKLFAVSYSYSRDYSEAEDTLHDGFMKIFSNISQYSFKGSFEGWMRRIIVNTALEKYRMQKHLYVDDDFEYNQDIGYEEIISNINADDLLEIIKELPPKYKMVFNLFAIEGYSHKEISEMLKISEGTSKSNLARARYILIDKVRKQFPINTIGRLN